MAIVIAGKEFRKAEDAFYVNGIKVVEAYADGVKVYPDKEYKYELVLHGEEVFQTFAVPTSFNYVDGSASVSASIDMTIRSDGEMQCVPSEQGKKSLVVFFTPTSSYDDMGYRVYPEVSISLDIRTSATGLPKGLMWGSRPSALEEAAYFYNPIDYQKGCSLNLHYDGTRPAGHPVNTDYDNKLLYKSESVDVGIDQSASLFAPYVTYSYRLRSMSAYTPPMHRQLTPSVFDFGVSSCRAYMVTKEGIYTTQNMAPYSLPAAYGYTKQPVAGGTIFSITFTQVVSSNFDIEQ